MSTTQHHHSGTLGASHHSRGSPKRSQTPSHASLMPTSKPGLPADGPCGRGAVPLDQALPQMLDLLGQPLHQRETGGLHHLPLEVLQTHVRTHTHKKRRKKCIHTCIHTQHTKLHFKNPQKKRFCLFQLITSSESLILGNMSHEP